MIKVSAQSQETFKQGPVFAKLAGSQINPTTQTPKAAVVLEGVTPGSGDYFNQSWDTDTTGVTPKYSILVEVGSGSLIGALTAGKVYDVWLQWSFAGKTLIQRGSSVSVYA
jgi:hypothetical protein